MEPVLVTGLAANFSPMPRMAPPPFGSAIDGGEKALGGFSDSPFCRPFLGHATTLRRRASGESKRPSQPELVPLEPRR